MASNVTLLSQTGAVGSGPIVSFPGTDNIRTVQLNPQVGVGFTGSVVIEGSNAASPGANDFVTLVSITFAGHMYNLSLDIESSITWVRARIVTGGAGAIAIFGSSRNGAIAGSTGSTPATALVDSALRVLGTGSSFNLNTPVVPQFSSDDVFYANNFSQTLTDVLNGTNGATGKQDKIGTGAITASEADVNTLTGTATYGLVTADLQKLADLNVTATELNRVAGVTSNVQTQLTALSSGKADATTVPANKSWVDSFFTVAPTVTIGQFNLLGGLTATAAEINVLHGTSGQVTTADLVKLGDITATASAINTLTGFTGSSTDLNKIVGLTTTTADLNAIAGLAGSGVSTTQLGYLQGLTTNVQTALSAVPNLVGLTATANDLNTLTGIFSGTGAYPGTISATEIGYLDGLSSNIQTQLNNKRDISTAIGISEISGSSISITELNYLQGASSNIQAQINAITTGSITPSGGTFTGAVTFAAGSAAAPSLRFTSALTSGIFRYSGTGVGVTVAGTQFLAADGTNFIIGNGSTNGSPTMRGTGFGMANPSYTFTNDTNTGMYWSAADIIGFAVGGANILTLDGSAHVVTVGGAASSNNAVTVSGIFGGEKLLGSGSVAVGSSGTTGQVTLYTVPSGRTAVVTRVYAILTAVTGTSNHAFRVNIGFGASFNEIVNNTANITLFNPAAYTYGTVGQIIVLGVGDNAFPAISSGSGANYQILTSGTVLKADKNVLDGSASVFTMNLLVFGFEY